VLKKYLTRSKIN